MDIPAPDAGTIIAVRVAVGNTVSAGHVIGDLDTGQRLSPPSASVADVQGRPARSPAAQSPAAQSPATQSRRRSRRPAGAATCMPRCWCSAPARAATPPLSAPPTWARRWCSSNAPDPGRGVPERRLHPFQGAAARGQGDRRSRGDGRAGCQFGDPGIDLDRLRAWKESWSPGSPRAWRRWPSSARSRWCKARAGSPGRTGGGASGRRRGDQGLA